MPINSDKPHLWKADVEDSIDFYNDWFLRFAPETYRSQRSITAKEVARAFEITHFLRSVTPEILAKEPAILPILRMACAPPIARDRLMGIARVGKSLILSMEGTPDVPPRVPPRMDKGTLHAHLTRISETLLELADRDLLGWLESDSDPDCDAVERAATVVADRLCGATSDPIIRNAQEQRQLSSLQAWLEMRGYTRIPPSDVLGLPEMPAGMFAFRLNVTAGKAARTVNIPIDCVIMPHGAKKDSLPILLEAKSAGDATNTNKRRKEEAQKYRQLTETWGRDVVFVLLLCGYFEPGYLGYEASEGIDWIWEHRLNDLDRVVPGKREPKKTGRAREEAESYRSSPQNREELRQARQLTLDGMRTQENRNRLGQFSTPYMLAQQIVEEALAVSFEVPRLSFLEPALGSGVFFSALEKSMPQDRIVEAVGVEVDAEYASVAASLWNNHPWKICTEDFIRFSLSSENQGRFSLLCTNPPYVRHHHLSSELKQELQGRILDALGLRTSGLSGLYVYFMLLAHSTLREGAVAAWLVPSEFLFVNYGKPLRDYLLNSVELVRIHQFDPADVQFDDALVSSCVVIYRKSHPDREGAFRYTFGGNLAHPRESVEVSRNDASLGGKWVLRGCHKVPVRPATGLRISDLFDVRRGIATGANDFFILDDDRAMALEIPPEFLRPILTRPRIIPECVVEADDHGYPLLASSKRFHLLDCRLSLDVVRERHPRLREYLESGERQGISDAYLCSRRKPWYLQERREPALYMATYMTRKETEGQPFRFFLNRSRATATNVFVLLYPKPALHKYLLNSPSRMIDLLKLLNGLDRNLVLSGGRSYGGGLYKLEPRELASLPLPADCTWLADFGEKDLLSA